MNQPQTPPDAQQDQRTKLLALAAALDGYDYYQILRVPQTASDLDIKQSYYKMKRVFHPDRYYNLGDEALKEGLVKIAKRITEAYTILTDPKRRKTYTDLVNGPERAQHLRFSQEQEDLQKQAQKEAVCKHPQAQKAYQEGITHLKRERWEQAARAFATALMFEPANEQLKELKKQAEGNIKHDMMIK